MAATGQLTVAAILVAAGDGRRLGAAVPKAFCEVGGVTLLAHAARQFAAHPAVRDLVVVAPASMLNRAASTVPSATVVAGGAARQQSVAAGLGALRADVSVVLVHDVARPFVPAEVITRVLDAVAGGADAVIPVLAVTDTIKQVDGDGAVLGTVDRAGLRSVQTPQGFRRAAIDAAHAPGGDTATDDAALIEAAGGLVVTVAGSTESFKITSQWDLRVAEAVYG